MERGLAQKKHVVHQADHHPEGPGARAGDNDSRHREQTHQKRASRFRSIQRAIFRSLGHHHGYPHEAGTSPVPDRMLRAVQAAPLKRYD
jgi:hypothetical protein